MSQDRIQDKDPDRARPLRLLSCGELLWDLFEGEQRIGGAAFNLAAHAARCGLEAHLLSRVGSDALGHQALQEAARLRVATGEVQIDPVRPTGTVTVALSAAGQPTYTIHAPVAWDFITAEPAILQRLAACQFDAVCFGTLAQRAEVSHATLQRVLEICHADIIFFDVNLRQQFYSRAVIEQGLNYATVLKLNDEELPILAEMLFSSSTNLTTTNPANTTNLANTTTLTTDFHTRHTLSSTETLPQDWGPGGELFKSAATAFTRELQRRYPQLRTILITLGAQGCLVVEGAEVVAVPGKQVIVVDAVGAGDAFSAAFLAARLHGKSAVEAVQEGNALGAYVAARRGAVPTE